MRFAPVQSCILEHLAIGEILALTLTSKLFGDLLPLAHKTRWNIYNCLQPYFKDTAEFRRLQASTGTLIVEDFARHFYTGTTGQIEKLELCVLSAFEHLLAGFLVQEGYEGFEHPSEVEKEGNKNAPNLYTWKETNGETKKMIWVYVDEDRALQNILRQSEATACLNFIMRDKTYSIFRSTTFLRRHTYPMAEFIPERIKSRDEWKAQGLVVENTHRLLEGTSTAHPIVTRERRIGDRYTWAIPLSTAGIETADDAIFKDHAYIETATFRLHYHKEEEDTYFYELRFSFIHSPILFHDYITAGPCSPCKFSDLRAPCERPSCEPYRMLQKYLTALWRRQMLTYLPLSIEEGERIQGYRTNSASSSEIGSIYDEHWKADDISHETWPVHDHIVVGFLDYMYEMADKEELESGLLGNQEQFG